MALDSANRLIYYNSTGIILIAAETLQVIHCHQYHEPLSSLDDRGDILGLRLARLIDRQYFRFLRLSF